MPGKIVMTDLTDRERKALLDAAKKVHAYKLMQAKGYERLVKKAKGERTKQLLADISADEFKDSEYWSQKIQELGGKGNKFATASFMNRRVSLPDFGVSSLSCIISVKPQIPPMSLAILS